MGLNDLDLATDYRTAASDPIGKFYLPCLGRSTLYLRAAGYFRSSILLLMGSAYVEFAKDGGKAIIVCSPDLEPSDIEAINSGEMAQQDVLARSLMRDLDLLLASREAEKPLKILATLVAMGSVKISIAYRPNAIGMYHEKIGGFFDRDDHCVSFIGSANETYSAWSERGNFESVEVFCSWHSDRDRARTEKHGRYLKSLIANEVPGLSVVDFPEAAKLRLFEKACSSLDEISPTVISVQTTSRRDPMEHQKKGLSAWKEAGYRGVLQHATGSGKTFTAILAIAEHTSAGAPALVLVPSELLQTQWRREIAAELPNAVVLLAGGGAQRWRERFVLESHTTTEASSHPRITIAVMATAGSKEFRAKLMGGTHLLVVADEVHQIGSPEYSQFMSVDCGKRLGLSATPQRYGDPEGTARILSYFGDILEPIVTLQDAISSGRLVPYNYHPHGIRLTDEEAKDWRQLSQRIGQLINRSSGDASSGASMEGEVKKLLIRRSRIAKKAAHKAPLAANIICENYRPGERWLVYCEDVKHMEEVSELISQRGIHPTLYHSAMSADRNQTLDWFEKGGGILLAVRCLDEGIDIPSVTHAVILASSQNPRQFIQRRGRILRQYPGKDYATLHDLLVLPVDDDNDPLGSLESEFVRAVGFANDAINQSSHAVLLDLAIQSGIDISKHYSEIEDEGHE